MEQTTENQGTQLYILDTITIAGVPVSECGLDEQSYNILREKFEAVVAGIVDPLTKQLDEQQAASQAEAKRLNDLNSQLTETSIATMQENHQLKLENESITTGRDNAARLLDEANETIAKQAAQIEGLKKQIADGHTAANVDFGDQIRQQEEAKKASRIKVISMVKTDPSGLSDRLWDIVLASTGEQFTINYLEKGKYTVITAEEAAQIQAEVEASKNIPVLPQVPESPEVSAAIPDMAGNTDTAEVVGTETEAIVIPVSREEHDALASRVTAIEAKLSIQAAA